MVVKEREELEEIRFSARQKALTVGVMVLLAIVFLVLVRHIVVPFICAIIVAYVLNPVVDWLSARSRLKRVYVVGGIFVLFIGGLVGFLWLFLPLVYREVREVGANYPTIISGIAANIGGESQIVILGETIDSDRIVEMIKNATRELPQGALHLATRTLETIAQLFFFLVATFFMLRDAPRISQGARNLLPHKYRDEILGLVGRIHKVLGAYIRGQMFLIVFMSAVTWIVLGPIMHLRYALVISLATGVLELFPIIGPVLAGTIACSIALFQTNDLGWQPWVYALVIAGIYTVLRHMEDYLVIPNVIGRIVDLHPLAILFALVSGAAIGGILGMFLAVPVTAVLKIVGEYLIRKLET